MDALNLRGLTLGLIKTGLVKGTGHSYTTSVTSNGMINGKYVTVLTAQTNQALPVVDALSGEAFRALTDNQATVIVVGQTAAGAIAMCQGSIVDTEVGITTTAGAFKVPPQFPALPEDFMVMGYLLARTAPSAANWTPATDDWDATGVTCSQFVQCGTLPARPQSS
jgi:hypothetical protein